MSANTKFLLKGALFLIVIVGFSFLLISEKYSKNTAKSSNKRMILSEEGISQLDGAISRAKEFYVNEYLERSLSAVEHKKIRVLFSEGGSTSEVSDDYIPGQKERVKEFDKYVEYQLYTVVHFLMYFHEWGYAVNDPFVERGREWLVSTFDEKQGKWEWSEQGCLHSKAIIALIRLGEMEKAKKAMSWALQSNVRVRDGFTERHSDAIIHSVSSNALNRGSKDDVHTKINREATAKYLYAMAALGMKDGDEFQKVVTELERSYSSIESLDIFMKNFDEVVAVSWIIYAYDEHHLPKDALYEKAKGFVISLAGEDMKNGSLMNYERGKIFSALALIGDDVRELQKNMFRGIIANQLSDGSWEPNGSKTNTKRTDWDASKVYDGGFLLHHRGGYGSTTKTILEALIVFKNSMTNLPPLTNK